MTSHPHWHMATESAVAWHARLEDLRHDLTSTLTYGHRVCSSMACTVRGLATWPHIHTDIWPQSPAVAWHERLETLRHDLTSTLTYGHRVCSSRACTVIRTCDMTSHPHWHMATESAVAWHARLEDLRHDLTSTLTYGHSVCSSMACTVRGLATWPHIHTDIWPQCLQ